MSIKVYVEGGGDKNPSLNRQCRAGFREFFEKAGLKGSMPKVIPCGSREKTYDRFCTAINDTQDDSFIVLLVDSEAAVAASDSPWEHLKKCDKKWIQPSAAVDDNAQLMVQCMEAWFVADRQSLGAYFGKDFNAAALPARDDVEAIAKGDLEPALKQATRSCSKGSYNKGRHSFELLGCLDPSKVMDASHHAKRLIDALS